MGPAFDLQRPHQQRHAHLPGGNFENAALGNCVHDNQPNVGKSVNADGVGWVSRGESACPNSPLLSATRVPSRHPNDRWSRIPPAERERATKVGPGMLIWRASSARWTPRALPEGSRRKTAKNARAAYARRALDVAAHSGRA